MTVLPNFSDFYQTSQNYKVKHIEFVEACLIRETWV